MTKRNHRAHWQRSYPATHHSAGVAETVQIVVQVLDSSMLTVDQPPREMRQTPVLDSALEYSMAG